MKYRLQLTEIGFVRQSKRISLLVRQVGIPASSKEFNEISQTKPIAIQTLDATFTKGSCISSYFNKKKEKINK
jgi:hypothetical protein